MTGCRHRPRPLSRRLSPGERARASGTVAARAFGPDPAIAASKSVLTMMFSGDAEVSAAVHVDGHVGFPGLTTDEFADLEMAALELAARRVDKSVLHPLAVNRLAVNHERPHFAGFETTPLLQRGHQLLVVKCPSPKFQPMANVAMRSPSSMT